MAAGRSRSSGPPGVPDPPVRLPSTPWPVNGGDASAYPATNGHARPHNGHAPPPSDRPTATTGWDIARFAVPDGPARPPGPALTVRAPDGRRPRSRAEAQRAPPPPPQASRAGRLRVASTATSRCRHTGPVDGPPRPPEPQAWRGLDGAHPAEAGPAWLGSGPCEPLDEPTVPDGLARAVEPEDDAEDGPAGFPGRHRRRAGESPDERPASTYREQAAAGGWSSRGWQSDADRRSGRNCRSSSSSRCCRRPHPDVHREGLRDPVGLDGDHAARLHRLPERPGARRQDHSPVLATRSRAMSVVFRGPDGWTERVHRR